MVIIANVGEKATVTVDQEGEVAAGSPITGSITDIDPAYNAYVFVDGVKVAVDENGDFSGTAANSAKVAVAYAKKSAWFTDPFVRYNMKGDIGLIGATGCTAWDGEDHLSISGGPSSQAGILEYSFSEVCSAIYDAKSIYSEYTDGANTKYYYGRCIVPSKKYQVNFGSGYSTEGALPINAYGATWNGGNNATLIPLKAIDSEDAVAIKMNMFAINPDNTKIYGFVGGTVYCFNIVDDGNTPAAITELKLAKTWDVKADCGSCYAMSVYDIGGKEIVYIGGDKTNTLILDTTTDTWNKYQLDATKRAYQVKVSGVATGTPHLTMAWEYPDAADFPIRVYALTADGLALASETPIETYMTGTSIAIAGRIGVQPTEDETKAVFGYMQYKTNAPYIRVVESKPAQLIVRGRISDAEPDDRSVDFGGQASVKFDAPEGKEITAVTINGAAVAGFTAADSYTFTTNALTEYTLVKMTVADKTYDLTFKSESYTADYTTNVIYGAAFADVKPEDPVVEGKSFTGWTPVVDTIVADNTFTAQFTNNIYYVTFYTNSEVAAKVEYEFGDKSITFPVIEGVTTWSNEQFTAAFEFDGNIANNDQKAYAVIVAPAPVIPVDEDDKKLDDNGKAAAEKTIEVFGDAAAVTEWAAKVYENGKIPAEKLNGTTEELIKIAKEYDLPIMTDPEVEITQAEDSTGFEFQILDAKVPVAIQAEKVLSMVEFTSDLGDATKPFAAATANDVTVTVKTDKLTATADFTKKTSAGFMRVKLSVPTTATK